MVKTTFKAAEITIVIIAVLALPSERTMLFMEKPKAKKTVPYKMIPR